jgi:2-dehydropantoate 2-reductase
MSDASNFSPQSFAVVGAGPVGCIVACFLAKGGYEVTLCDVIPDLLAPALDPGIILEGAENIQHKVTRTCTHIDELADYDPDVIFITVKAHALPLIASAIEGFHKEGMAIVSWQNGIDTELELAKILGETHVMRAVVNYGCGLAGPAHVKIPFDALSKCDLTTEHTDNIISMVWRKSVMNACMNPVCAVTGLTMSRAMNDPIVFQIVDALVKECIRVARANEIDLGWDFYTHAMAYMGNAGDHKPSMLMDIEANRRTEIDFINGKFVEYGARTGTLTPYNHTLSALVKGLESK